MKYIVNTMKKMSALLVIPMLVGCGGGQEVTGLSSACPLPGTYSTTVLKATEEDYKDVLVVGTSKYFVEEKIDVGTGYVLGLSHVGESCLVSSDFLHFFEIKKSVYDQLNFQLTVNSNYTMDVKSIDELEAEAEAEAAAKAAEAAAKAAEAEAKAAASASSGSGISSLKMPVEAPPAPVPIY